MVDDRKKDAKNRMEDRTVPMPVPRGGTLSADTLEADPQSFIGEEHLRPTTREPTAAARVPRPLTSAPPQTSFDEEIAKNRAPAPRPATTVRRSPLASVQESAEGGAPAVTHVEVHEAAQMEPQVAEGAAQETSDPSPSSVFATRAHVTEAQKAAASTAFSLGASAESMGASAAAVTAAHNVDASIARAAGASEPEPSAILSAEPYASAEALDDDAATLPIDAPTIPLAVAESVSAPVTAPVADVLVSDAGPTLEQTAALPAQSLVPASDPLSRLPDRIDPAERERLANEATRIRTKTTSSPSGRGLKVILLLVGLGVGAAATATAVRAPASTTPVQNAPVVTTSAPARAPPATRTEERAPDTGSALVVNVTTSVAPDASDAPLGSALTTALEAGEIDSRARVLRRGFFDQSGTGAVGLAQALEAGVRPALAGARRTGLAVRGEVVRANVVRGEAVLDCNLTIVDAQVRRVTLQASARAQEKGQKADRLLRIAAERCGQSLQPELSEALTVLARR